MANPTVVHLFAGSGGCTLGFARAGFRSLGSFDFDAAACRDLERLTGGPAFCVDLAAMQPGQMLELTGECPDVVVMSPPCKSFSGCMPAARAGEAHYVDMSQLAVRGVFLALEAWAPKRPRLVLLENVPRIQSRGAALLAQVVALLQRSGYTTDQRTHDCGALGGLAQHRDRFLLVARQLETCTDVLRRPPPQRVRNVGEVLGPLPSPAAPHSDEMHRLPLLSPLNWLRLAAIRAGKDWRDLPAAIRLGGEARRAGAYEVLDSEAPGKVVRGRHDVWAAPASVADPRVGFASANTHSGLLGVEDFGEPAHTVTANARVQASRGAVADPRVGWDPAAHGGRPDSWGVGTWASPSLTVRGRQEVQTSRASIADPRLAESATRFKGKLGVEDWDEVGHTVIGAGAQTGKASVADPRLSPRSGRQNGGFGVEAADAPAHAVLGEGTVRNTRSSVADPRVGGEKRPNCYGVGDFDQPALVIRGMQRTQTSQAAIADPRLGCEPRDGSFGVLDGDAPSGVVIGHHRHDNAPGSVADPRVTYRSAEREAAGGHSGRGDFGVLDPATPSPTVRARHEVRQAPAAVVDERGWPVPTHELVREGDELVLYGPAIDLTTKRACLLVIRAPDGTWHRPLTDRELAVLQGFPVDAQLEGPSSSSKGRAGRREHIGNAIPPPTAEAIAREAAATLRSTAQAGFLVGGDVWVERAEAVQA